MKGEFLNFRETEADERMSILHSYLSLIRPLREIP